MRRAVASSGGSSSRRRFATVRRRLACAERLTAAITVPVAAADRRRDRAQPDLELLVDERPALPPDLAARPQRVGVTVAGSAAQLARSR